MKKFLLSIVATFLLAGNAHSFMSGVKPEKDGGAAIEILSGVIHTSPPGSNVNAGYGTIINNTSNDIILTQFRSPVFDSLEAHSMEYSAQGIAKMIHMHELLIPANNEVRLTSGGLHLMFIGKRRDLTLGEEILVVTTDKKEVRYMLNLKVTDPRVGHNNHDHHMH